MLLRCVMKFIIFILFALTAVSCASEQTISGCLPSYKNLDLKKLTYLDCLIFFSGEPNEDGSIKLPKKLLEQMSVKTKGIERFLCIGGWGKSKYFPAVSGDKVKRKKFINELKSLVEKYSLDGIDFDWEHPKNKKEEEAYEKLIHESSLNFKVSVAAAGWQKFTKGIFKSIYRINLMSYDHGGEHATFEKSVQDVDNFIKMGCPAKKISLGVPFYGRHVKSRQAKTYAQLKAKIKGNEDLVDGYYFNNVATLKKKAAYAKEKGLAGIMIWEIEQDCPDYTLLKTLRKALPNSK